MNFSLNILRYINNIRLLYLSTANGRVETVLKMIKHKIAWWAYS